MDELHEKFERLRAYLASYGRVAVAFSAGVDSTFLLKVAHDLLGERALAVTASSALFMRRDLVEGEEFCRAEGIRQIIVETDELAVEGFRENPPDRCYICKRDLFSRMIAAARREGVETVAEGSNLDDLGDYRPGLRAIAELGVASPLREAGLTKADIRALSRELGLRTWDKPSCACLASRFAYGEEITAERLERVEAAEEFLREMGFSQVRVRVHGNIARIEAEPVRLPELTEPETARRINERLRSLGFMYVAVDLGGYYQGSMNRALEAAPPAGK